MNRPRRKRLKRHLDSTILHFDYDCFYASVFEREQPHLKMLPLAVQQKQIIVTCNYEARRRGLYKLQLVADAKKICPDVVIVLGEDLTQFRNASKQLYAFLSSFSWNARCERLGFDEVWLDVSDLVDNNMATLNTSSLDKSFFRLSKADPTLGFFFDATHHAGHVYPETSNEIQTTSHGPLHLRLLLASHLARHIRQRLENDLGYMATVGVSTNKLLSKLVGNLHKPNSQTTLIPPYTAADDEWDNVTHFIDDHEVGKLPGIGFRIAQKLRAHVLQRPANIDAGLVYGGTKEDLRVRAVRTYPGIGPEVLERILGGPGIPHGIGARVWDLLNGCDDTQVNQAREVPRQISIEDSYIRLDTLDKVIKQLHMLSISLLKRIRTDLLEHEEEPSEGPAAFTTALPQRWLAHPKTLRLSTRPRPPQTPDRNRNRTFARISKSASMPNFVFSVKESIESLAERLVRETLIPLFRQLHPEKQGWNLSLINLAAINMANAASEKGGVGRDIGTMFRRQDDALAPFRVRSKSAQASNKRIAEQHMGEEQTKAQGMMQESYTYAPKFPTSRFGSEDVPTPSQEDNLVAEDAWKEEGDIVDSDVYHCDICGAVMPLFAMGAHERWHSKT